MMLLNIKVLGGCNASNDSGEGDSEKRTRSDEIGFAVSDKSTDISHELYKL